MMSATANRDMGHMAKIVGWGMMEWNGRKRKTERSRPTTPGPGSRVQVLGAGAPSTHPSSNESSIAG